MAKMARSSRLAALLLILALPAPVAAQYGQPTPAPSQMMPGHGQGEASHSTPAPPAAPAAAAEVFAGAACVVGHNATAGDALLGMQPYSAAERAEAVRLLAEMRRCTHHGPIVSQASVIRAAFAEAAVELGFPTPPAARTPPLDAAPLVRPTEGDPAFLAQVMPMFQLADCATPRRPDLARAVLATDPESQAEAEAVSALNPVFIACVPAGSQLRIDHKIMRYLFAEALYRWSGVQRDGPASPWAAAPAAAGH